MKTVIIVAKCQAVEGKKHFFTFDGEVGGKHIGDIMLLSEFPPLEVGKRYLMYAAIEHVLGTTLFGALKKYKQIED